MLWAGPCSRARSVSSQPTPLSAAHTQLPQMCDWDDINGVGQSEPQRAPETRSGIAIGRPHSLETGTGDAEIFPSLGNSVLACR